MLSEMHADRRASPLASIQLSWRAKRCLKKRSRLMREPNVAANFISVCLLQSCLDHLPYRRATSLFDGPRFPTSLSDDGQCTPKCPEDHRRVSSALFELSPKVGATRDHEAAVQNPEAWSEAPHRQSCVHSDRAVDDQVRVGSLLIRGLEDPQGDHPDAHLQSLKITRPARCWSSLVSSRKMSGNEPRTLRYSHLPPTPLSRLSSLPDEQWVVTSQDCLARHVLPPIARRDKPAPRETLGLSPKTHEFGPVPKPRLAGGGSLQGKPAQHSRITPGSSTRHTGKAGQVFFEEAGPFRWV